MSTRKTTLFYALLIAVSSLAVGMVIASRLDLTPVSSAQPSFTAPAMNSAPITGPIDAQTFRNIAKAQQPMVVNIRTEAKARGRDLSDFFGGGGGSPDDFFHRFFQGPDDPDDQAPPQQGQGQGRRPRRREQTTVAAGTGFIISKDGLILTNNHVIEDATKIEVSLFGEESDQTYAAKLIGRDALTDSALIQLTEKPTHPLPEAKFGDSAQMAAGDWVMAIGNPFGQGWTVTVGIVSATGRAIQGDTGRPNEMIQTDAAINPGNSGGPLLNLRGEVIGINTMIFTNARSEGNIGIGFAVPINTVRELLPQLANGKVTRGRIGLTMTNVPREDYQSFGLKSRSGAVVSTIIPGGAADKAGIKPGDVITDYNGRAVQNTSELQKMVTATKPGTSVPIKVMRNGKEQTLHASVEELDLEAERGQQSRNNQREQPEEQGQESFGLTLSNVTPQMARRLQLPSGQTGAVITDVDPNGPSAGALRQGDVILSVNGQRISTAAEAGRELQKVPSGRIARILVWRMAGNEAGEVFVTVRKE